MKAKLSFNPERVAYFEKEGWKAYYDRDWLRVFRLMVALNREQFHMPAWTAIRAALDILRASVVFAPVEHDISKAAEHLREYYKKAVGAAQIQANPAELARLEMDYWVIHRELAEERKKEPQLVNIQPMVDSLSRLHSTLFGISSEQAKLSAEYRAKAAQAVDRITGRYSKDVSRDWQEVEDNLFRAYHAIAPD